MGLKLKLVLCILLGVLSELKGEENVTIRDYFRIDCGQHKINPFDSFCRDGAKVLCDESHCMERLVEDSRIGCALFCEQVLFKLEQLLKEVAVLKTEQNKSTAMIEEQETENSKLRDEIKKQKLTIANMNTAISDEKQRNRNLQDQKQILVIVVFVLVILILITLLLLFLMLKKKYVNQKSKKSCLDIEEPFIPKTRAPETGSGADSAFESIQAEAHKCNDLKKVKPTDDDEKALVAPNDLQKMPQKWLVDERNKKP